MPPWPGKEWMVAAERDFLFAGLLSSGLPRGKLDENEPALAFADNGHLAPLSCAP